MASPNEKLLQLDPATIYEKPGWNVRLPDDPDNIAHIDALAESIFNVGVLQPLTVCDYNEAPGFGWMLTDGHCRLAAVRLAIQRGAPIKTIPARLEPKHSTDADHAFSVIARNTGKNLSQLELGVQALKMTKFGWSEQDIAAKSGYSLQHIRNVLALATAGDTVTKLVETGHVAPTLAVQAIAAEGAQAGEVLTQAVEIAKEEEAAKPKPAKAKAGKDAKPEKEKPVKATAKHVAKAKGVAPKPKSLATKQKQPEPSSMVSDDKLTDQLRASGFKEGALWELFDSFGKRRSAVLKRLVDKTFAAEFEQAAPDTALQDAYDNLRNYFDQVVCDTPEPDGTLVLVINANAWNAACALLDIDRAVAVPTAPAEPGLPLDETAA